MGMNWGSLGKKLWWESQPRFRRRLMRLLTGEYSRSSAGCCRLVEDYVFGVVVVRVRIFKNGREPRADEAGDFVATRVFDVNMAWWAGWRTKRALDEARELVEMWNTGAGFARVMVVEGRLGPPGIA